MHLVGSRHPPIGVILCTGEILRYADSILDSFEMVLAPPGSVRFAQRGAAVANGLNKGIRKALTMHEREPDKVTEPVQGVWIMGDDHCYPADIILRLLDREVDVIAPLVLNRHPPFRTVVHKWVDDREVAKPVYEMPESGLYTLADDETCGDAALLIRRPVLEALGDPWYPEARSGSLTCEDQALTRRIKEAGFDIHIDVDIVMGHTTPMGIWPKRLPDGSWGVELRGGNGKPFVEFPVRVPSS